jgi:hypothetical protein
MWGRGFRQHGDLISLLLFYFFQSKGSRLKTPGIVAYNSAKSLGWKKRFSAEK